MRMYKVCMRPVDKPGLCAYSALGGLCTHKHGCKYMHVMYIIPARQRGKMFIGKFPVFVLRPDKDPAAVEALRAYAEATDNKTLSDDIYNWVGNGVTVQKWIPVSERLPKHGDIILCYTKYREISVFQWDSAAERWLTNTWDYRKDSITHWMPLPEPPTADVRKGCE